MSTVVSGIDEEFLLRDVYFHIILHVDSELRFKKLNQFLGELYNTFCEIDSDDYETFPQEDGSRVMSRWLWIGDETVDFEGEDTGYSSEIQMKLYNFKYDNDEAKLYPIETIIAEKNIHNWNYNDRKTEETIEYISEGDNILIAVCCNDVSDRINCVNLKICKSFVNRFVKDAALGIQLGSSQSYGYGKVHCTDVQYHINENIVQQYTERNKIWQWKINEYYKEIDEFKNECNEMIAENLQTIADNLNASWKEPDFYLEINVQSKYGILIKSTGPKSKQYGNMLTDESGNPFIPASTIKGLLHSNSSDLQYYDCPVFDSTISKTSRCHVDKFSGGMINSTKNTETYVNGKFTIKFGIKKKQSFSTYDIDNPRIDSKTLIELLRFARDLNDERINIGSGYAIGKGFVKVDTVIAGSNKYNKKVILNFEDKNTQGDIEWLKKMIITN